MCLYRNSVVTYHVFLLISVLLNFVKQIDQHLLLKFLVSAIIISTSLLFLLHSDFNKVAIIDLPKQIISINDQSIVAENAS